MISENSIVEPLTGDPARQAVYSLRGYVYQIWRTVEAWVQLKQGETLYIECAEDFDIVAAESSVAVQIKNTEKPISLGSADARNAIVNFWRLRQKNANVHGLRFRFLTRGSVTQEKDKYFGEHSGIDVWRAGAKGDVSSIEALRGYLSEQIKSEIELAEFFLSTSADDLRDRFLAPFEWITDEPDIALVEESIKRILVAHGYPQGIQANVSVKAMDGLLARCVEIAQHKQLKQRSLTFEDFLLVFSDKTSISFPQNYALINQMIQGLTSGSSQQEKWATRSARPCWRSEPPPLPEPVLLRPNLVAQIQSALGKKSPLLISGTVGKGKTTLAKLVAAAGYRCIWIELAGRDAEYVEDALAEVSQVVSKSNDCQLIVVDNFDIELGVSRAHWNGLELLNRACRMSGKFLLLTAKGIPPDRIDGRLKVFGTTILSVPDFDISEIETFFSEMGCPKNECLVQLAHDTMEHTGGHPKLVQLRGLELKDQNWPVPSAGELDKTPACISEQRATERLDLPKTVQGPALDYLYLLTLVTLPFNRELALDFASSINGLTEPGNCFDQFIGRWIETVEKNKFRITSLLADEAENAWGVPRCEKAHAEIFDAYFSRGVSDVSEAFSVFTHALKSKDHERIGTILQSLLSPKSEMLPLLAKNLRPLLSLGQEAGAFFYPTHKGISLLIRLLQFRVAEREEPGESGRILQVWEWEIEQLPAGEVHDRNQFMRAFVVAGSMSPAITPRDAIKCLIAIDKHSEAWATELGLAFRNPSWDDGPADPITVLFTAFQLRCNSIDYLSQLLTELTTVSPILRDRMLKAFERQSVAGSGFIFESAWISAEPAGKSSWALVVDVLRTGWHLAAQEWGHRAMATSAARSISIVLDEYLNDRSGAEEIIALTKERFSGCPELDDQLANIFFRHNEHEKAVALIETALTMKDDDRAPQIKDPFAFRRAGISAMKVGRIELAAKMFVSGAYWAEKIGLHYIQAGLYFDAAYCAFEARSFELMRDQLVLGLPAIAGRPDPANDFRGFALQKLAGAVVLWMLNEAKNAEPVESGEPQVGCCSNPDLYQRLKDLPSTPYEITLANVIELEDVLRLDPKCEGLYSSTLLVSRFPVARLKLSTRQIKKAFRKREFTNLPDLLWVWQRAFWEAKAQQENGQGPLEEFNGVVDPAPPNARLGLEYLLLGALALRLQAGDLGTCLEGWRLSVKSGEGAGYMGPVVAEVARSVIGDFAAAREVMLNNAAAGVCRIGAAISLLSIGGFSPDESAYAQLVILDFLRNSDAQFALEESTGGFSEMFSSLWAEHIKTPAALVNPRLTVPELQEIVRDPDDGARKLRRLLVAGSAACRVSIPAGVLAWLTIRENDEAALADLRLATLGVFKVVELR